MLPVGVLLSGGRAFGSGSLAGRIETAGMSMVGQAAKPPLTRLAERPNALGRRGAKLREAVRARGSWSAG